jgi:hypothetical protein
VINTVSLSTGLFTIALTEGSAVLPGLRGGAYSRDRDSGETMQACASCRKKIYAG